MATKLNFIKDGSKWVCELNPTVPFVAQVRMKEKKDFTVYGYIEDMEPFSMFASDIYDNLLFKVDTVVAGVTVRMVAHSEILEAYMIEES